MTDNITLPREVVKLALDALDYGGFLKKQQSITALRAALAQQTLNAPEECEHKADGWYAVQRVAGVTRVWPMTEAQALRAALAQQAEPVQEPVATLYGTLPIYDTAPHRKLVPLTEDEIYHATGHCGVSRYTAINITRAVEKASWEKNHGQA